MYSNNIKSGKKKINQFNAFRSVNSQANRQPDRSVLPGPEFYHQDIPRTIPHYFARQVQLNRDRIALVTHDNAVSYGELDRLSSTIAGELKRSIKNGPVAVALLFDQGIEMIAAMLAVLKSGHFYIPLDPAYPPRRLEYMLKDSAAAILLTHANTLPFALELAGRIGGNHHPIQVIDVETIIDNGYQDDRSTLPVSYPVEPDSIAYILYTSGSTGAPKGVIQSHKNIVHFIRVYSENLNLNKEDRVTLLCSYCFDAAVMDIYGALLNGSVLLPFTVKQENGIKRLIDFLDRQQATIYHSIPLVFRYLVRALAETHCFTALRLAVLGGEPVVKSDVHYFQRFFPDDCRFINGLGPTESTVTLQYIMDKNCSITREAVPVGFPVAGTRVYVLDARDREAYIYGSGELIYKSDYLALGYVNNPEGTAAVFVTDPVTGSGRVFRTGDTGRRLPGGAVEYICRKDGQIKIRGFRVEPAEIECQLDKISGIRLAVVKAWKNKMGENYLVAYYEKESSRPKFSHVEILRLLKESLPGYLIPSRFIHLERLPVTPSGKIDRAALPHPDTIIVERTGTSDDRPPISGTRKQLIKIWKEVLELNHDTIHPEDNFFQLGGHSLKVTQLTAAIASELGVTVPLADVFNSPTIDELADTIDRLRDSEPFSSIPLQPVEERDYYPVSPAQSRLYIHHIKEPGSMTFMMMRHWILEGSIDVSGFKHIFRQLIIRHEALRTSFFMHENQVWSRIQPVPCPLEPGFDIPVTVPAPNNSTDITPSYLPFDLTRAPLLRVTLVKQSEQRHHMFFAMHHIISDGISLDILLSDFIAIYKGNTLRPLPYRYRDYVMWQNHWLASDNLGELESYWMEQLTDYQITMLEPDHFEQFSHTIGASHTVLLANDIVSAMKKFCEKQDITPYIFLAAVFAMVLSAETGRTDITYGTPVSIREHTGLNHVVGIFLNVILLRFNLEKSQSFVSLVSASKDRIMKALENRLYPYDLLNRKLQERCDLPGAECISIMFNFLPPDENKHAIKSTDFNITPLPAVQPVPKYDITLYAGETGGGIHLTMVYKSNIYYQATIAAMLERMSKMVSVVLNNTHISLHNLFTYEDSENDFNSSF